MAANPKKIHAEAMKYVAKGDLGRALESYQNLLQLTPDDIKVWVSVGDICRKMGHVGQAVKFYANAARKYALTGQLLQAISINKIILEIEPKHKKTQKALASLYSKTSSAEEKPDVRKDISAPPPDFGDIGIELANDDNADDSGSLSVGEPDPPSMTAEPFDFLDEDSESDMTESDVQAAVSQLPSFPIFSDLDPNSFSAIIDELFHLSFGPGDMIVTEGDPGDSFYVICEGSARVVKNDPTGNQIELATLNAGDFFGEFAYMTGTPRTASIMASDNIRLLEFDRGALKKLEQEQPKITETLEQFYRKRLIGTVLKISPLMQPLQDIERNQLIREFTSDSVKQGTELISQGQPASSLYLIVSGVVSVTATAEDDTEKDIATLGVGEFFGEISLITGKNATATCTAVGNCKLYKLDSEQFQSVMQQHPDIVDTLRETAKQRINELKATLSDTSAEEKLAEAGLV